MEDQAINFTLYPKAPPRTLWGATTGLEGSAPHPHYACGKAILVGEHAVVYGAEAIAMPIPSLQMELTVKRAALDVDQPACTLGQSPAPQPLTAVVEDAFHLLGIKPYPVRIEGRSDILIGSGLGSSAALCVVILKALAANHGCEMATAELAMLGNELEKRFHGTPSGLDTAVVAYQQVIAFRKGTPSSCSRQGRQVEPLTIASSLKTSYQEWDFALINSQVRASTIAMIQRAAPYFCDPLAGESRLFRFNFLAQLAKEGLGDGQLEKVAAAMDEAAAMLTEGGVVPPLLAQIMEVCRDLGVAAAKPTGSGGGGCILALLKPQARNQQLAALEAAFGRGRVVNIRISPTSKGHWAPPSLSPGPASL